MHSIRPLLHLVALTLLLFSLISIADAAELPNTVCPVEPTEPAVAKYKTEYLGKLVYFCCKDCVEEFELNPGLYLKEIPQLTAEEQSAEAEPIRSFSKEPDLKTWWRDFTYHYGVLAGAGALLVLLVLGRITLAWMAKGSLIHRFCRAATSFKGILVILGLTLAAEAVDGRLRASHYLKAYDDLLWEDSIHFATYYDYGDPPVPRRPPTEPRLQATYYRGNDERSPKLFNNGYYRTTTFNIAIVDENGKPVNHGDKVKDVRSLQLKIETLRAPGTPNYFFTKRRMARIFVTKSSDRFMGRDEPVADAIAFTTVKPLWEFVMYYPLSHFETNEDGGLDGIVYMCEQWFDANHDVVGARMHFAIQCDLDVEEGRVGAKSDVWMGALYRTRQLPIWAIGHDEWFSHEPIPFIEGEQTTDDPTLLGITEHEIEETGRPVKEKK